MTDLHKKYAPILRFNKGEKFFPMRVDDMLPYSGLYLKGQDDPLIAPGKLTVEDIAKHNNSAEVFVRSVDIGPLTGEKVVESWRADALEMVLRWADSTPSWTENLAKQAYSWFSPTTKAATQLFWWNDLIGNLVQGAVESASSGELPRLILPVETQDNAIDRYQTASPAYTYYYREAEDGDYLSVQYWFFYSYNNWGQSFMGMNDHEGDWECVLLFFKLEGGRPQEPPAYVTYADHESNQTKAWPKVELSDRHPVVYVGAGSHASYPKASDHTLMELYNLVDQARGDGLTIGSDDWVHRINLNNVSWLNSYLGSWGTRFWLSTAKAKTILDYMLAATPFGGVLRWVLPTREIELPGVSAPHGPVPTYREQYNNPTTWAGVPPEK